MMWSAAARSTICGSMPWSSIGKLFWAATICFALSGGEVIGAILDPGDIVIAIDATGKILNGRYPAAENPPKAIDGNSASKYLNFGREGSGFIVTPFAPLPVESFQITTANDAPGRDPSSWELYGFDGPLVTVDSGPSPAINANGLAEAWVLVDSGAVALPGDPTMNGDQRGVLGPVVNVNPLGVGYEHYKMVFPTVKDPTQGNVDSLQFAEIQFYLDDLGTPAQALLTPTDLIVAVDGIKADDSRYPGGENPPKAIDDNSGTKYLNFGKEQAGLIVTNSQGQADVNWMRLTTANDATNRDPASYELYGTNDPIQSVDNSDGLGGEVWTLISSGPLSLPLARMDSTTIVPINASALYNSFKLIFPTLRNAPATSSMQIANVQFYVVPEPSTVVLVAMGGLAVVVARRRRRG